MRSWEKAAVEEVREFSNEQVLTVHHSIRLDNGRNCEKKLYY